MLSGKEDQPVRRSLASTARQVGSHRWITGEWGQNKKTRCDGRRFQSQRVVASRTAA